MTDRSNGKRVKKRKSGEAGRTADLRGLVLEILLEVNEKGANSSLVLRQVLDKYSYLPKRDRAFITRVAEGTLEYRLRLDYILDQFSNTPVNKLKPVIREILRSGVYQLLYMDSVPASAVCNEAVKLAAKRGFGGLKGFVNGVLRTISREYGNIVYPSKETEPVKALSVTYSMPEWIIQDWLEAYPPDTVEKMLASFLNAEPLTLRCQLSAATVEECVDLLEKEGVTVRRHPYLPYALQVDGIDRLEDLEAFRRGYFAVQDVSSMLVGQIAAPKQGDTVIDVCAAPGGKSLHMADLLKGTGQVYARDVTAYKTDLILKNKERLHAENVIVQVQDACGFDGASVESADLVLADVPCSGLGVIGKKNDIKYRMTKEGQKSLEQLQRQILEAVWRYVKPGGSLVYSTCTIHSGENEENVRWFLESHPFCGEDITGFLPEGMPGREALLADAKKGFVQLLPGVQDCDGFFIAKFRRI